MGRKSKKLFRKYYSQYFKNNKFECSIMQKAVKQVYVSTKNPISVFIILFISPELRLLFFFSLRSFVSFDFPEIVIV